MWRNIVLFLLIWICSSSLLAAASTVLRDDVADPNPLGLESDNDHEFVYAKAEIHANPTLPKEERKVQGTILMRQRKTTSQKTTEFNVTISGLTPNSLHGFHVHEFGQTRPSCSLTGGHFNPFQENHGAPSAVIRHVGDLGNVRSDDEGRVVTSFKDVKARLYSVTTIVGRAFVVHAGMDDYGVEDNKGSQTTGNAGPRLGCGPILWSDGTEWGDDQP